MNRTQRSRRLLLLVPTPREAELLFGQKAQGLAAPRLFTLAGRSVRVALTGFGLAAAGATAGRWLARVAPDAVLLVGVAGTFDPERFPVGDVLEADAVGCDGIGAGEGDRFVALAEPPLPPGLTRGKRLAPVALAPVLPEVLHGEVLSVAAAAGSLSMAEGRRRRHPDALVEEMEGYAVALAALVAGVPLTVLRGACNVAGDRDHRGWRVTEALERCRGAAEAWIERVTA